MAFAVEKISFYSQCDRLFLVGIFDYYVFFYYLFGFAFDLDVFLGKRLFSIADDLILEMVQSERVVHG